MRKFIQGAQSFSDKVFLKQRCNRQVKRNPGEQRHLLQAGSYFGEQNILKTLEDYVMPQILETAIDPLIKACSKDSEVIVFNVEAFAQKARKERHLIKALEDSFEAKQPKRSKLSVTETYKKVLKPSLASEESKILPSRFYRSVAKSSGVYQKRQEIQEIVDNYPQYNRQRDLFEAYKTNPRLLVKQSSRGVFLSSKIDQLLEDPESLKPPCEDVATTS